MRSVAPTQADYQQIYQLSGKSMEDELACTACALLAACEQAGEDDVEGERARHHRPRREEVVHQSYCGPPRHGEQTAWRCMLARAAWSDPARIRLRFVATDLGLAGQRGRHRNPVQTRSRRGLDAVLIER